MPEANAQRNLNAFNPANQQSLIEDHQEALRFLADNNIRNYFDFERVISTDPRDTNDADNFGHERQVCTVESPDFKTVSGSLLDELRANEELYRDAMSMCQSYPLAWATATMEEDFDCVSGIDVINNAAYGATQKCRPVDYGHSFILYKDRYGSVIKEVINNTAQPVDSLRNANGGTGNLGCHGTGAISIIMRIGFLPDASERAVGGYSKMASAEISLANTCLKSCLR